MLIYGVEPNLRLINCAALHATETTVGLSVVYD